MIPHCPRCHHSMILARTITNAISYAATVMPRDNLMAWCYIAFMSLAIAGVLVYKWSRPPCHTEFSRGGPFCEQMFAIKYITLLRLHSATKQ
jgi:hypothetical protein